MKYRIYRYAVKNGAIHFNKPQHPACFLPRVYNQPFIMFLRRLGNKSAIADKIINHFPQHNTYIELFFGAGGMYFNKPKAKYNFLNDLDSNVYNCFTVLMREKQSLVNYLEYMPVHSDFWNECKVREPETNIEKAVIDCFDTTFNSGIKAAMSEFDHPFIIEQAKQRNLNLIYIGERRNMKNRKTEILVTNYQKAPTLF